MKPTSIRSNALWAVFGNASYQVSQLVSVVVIARLLGTEALGTFALALAVCTPITNLSTLGLRHLQVVDVENKFALSDFRRVQLATSVAGLLAVFAVTLLISRVSVAIAIVIAAYISQAVNSQRDTFLAYFQKSRRMDLVACSRMVTSISSVVACASTAWWTRDLYSTIVAIAFARAFVMYAYDRPKCLRLGAGAATRGVMQIVKNCRDIIFTSISLGIANGVLALEISIQRFFLDSSFGSNSLGQFAILSTISMPVPFVMSSVSQAALPYLVRSGVRTGGLVIRMHLLVAALSLFVLALGWQFGPQLLKLFMGKEYSPIEKELMIALIGGYFAAAASVSNYVFISRRRFQTTLLLSAFSCIIVAIFSYTLIPDLGLTGSLVAAMTGRISVLLASTFLLAKHF